MEITDKQKYELPPTITVTSWNDGGGRTKSSTATVPIGGTETKVGKNGRLKYLSTGVLQKKNVDTSYTHDGGYHEDIAETSQTFFHQKEGTSYKDVGTVSKIWRAQ